LRSMDKFATGFSDLTILVPNRDADELMNLMTEQKTFPFHITTHYGEEWPGRGMLWHDCQEMYADKWCPEADYVAHFDADCIFTAPVTPGTFFKDGKPILRYEAFATLTRRHPNNDCWRSCTNSALPFPVDKEFMRGHPEVYHRSTYLLARSLIEQKHGKSLGDYLLSFGNDNSHNFCEYCTLGAVVYEKQRELYSPHDCAKQPNPDFQPYPVQQFWSHSPIDKPQQTWKDGSLQQIVPLELIKQYGIDG